MLLVSKFDFFSHTYLLKFNFKHFMKILYCLILINFDDFLRIILFFYNKKQLGLFFNFLINFV